MSVSPRILIAGAGSIGCYVGACLALAGRDVTFLLRPRIAEELRKNGLTLSDYRGNKRQLPPSNLKLVTDPADPLAFAATDIVLVTVKSAATEVMAQAIAAYARAGVMVISFQNGVGNADTLRNLLPQHRVVAGMVGFNVVQLGEGRFHCGSEGELGVPATGDLAALLDVEGLDCVAHADMTPFIWAKLLLNLNNALNALSGLPLREQLQDRAWRGLLATMMDEALAAMRAAGIRPARLTAAPAWALPTILRLPTPFYSRIAASMLKIDPQARSSMWEDLQQGRTTEVNYLQGAVLALANKYGLDARLCARVSKAIQVAEAAKGGSPGLKPTELV